MKPTKIERIADTYVARDAGDETLWSVELRLDTGGTPFREEVVWPAASVVAIAGGPTVHFLSRDSGVVLKSLSLDDDLFGHFGPTDRDVMYILGWRNVIAVDKTLAVRWVCRDVAVDGITWRGENGTSILLSAEMDPPGGWVDVALDAVTGREIARETQRLPNDRR